MKVVSIHSAPRSGSSWLQTIFEAHPNITTKYQPLFSYDHKNCITVDSTEEDFNNFINDMLLNDNEFVNRRSGYHKDENNIIPEFDKNEITALVMKHVRYHNLIETFIKLHPGIKIIGLVRSPYGVVNSTVHNEREHPSDLVGKYEWLTGSYKNSTCEENYFGYQKWKEVVDIFESVLEKYPDNIRIVQYETIVKHPEIQLRELFKFIDVEFNDNVMDFVNESWKEELSNDSTTSVFKTTNVIDKWKNQLDSEIIDYIRKDIKDTKYKAYTVY